MWDTAPPLYIPSTPLPDAAGNGNSHRKVGALVVDTLLVARADERITVGQDQLDAIGLTVDS